ncbi:MAG: hypothetical protein E7271_05110 [Lachnospiraceae bacterium]|jgi:hypothetical protein|nr:hypothetical protein [Lachnospiraceae bacterium]
MVSLINEYVSKIELKTDDMTKAIFSAALSNIDNIKSSSVIIKSNHYIVDIKLNEYDIDKSLAVANLFMERTRYHYSAYYIRFNEGDRVRYRYASCKENKEGFYCDIVIG